MRDMGLIVHDQNSVLGHDDRSKKLPLSIVLVRDGEPELAAQPHLAGDADAAQVNSLDDVLDKVEPEAGSFRYTLVVLDPVELVEDLLDGIGGYAKARVCDRHEHTPRCIVVFDADGHPPALGGVL